MPKFQNREDYDAWIIANAEYFTVVYFKGQGKYYRKECRTLKSALALADKLEHTQGRHPLVYAVKGTADAVVIRDPQRGNFYGRTKRQTEAQRLNKEHRRQRSAGGVGN